MKKGWIWMKKVMVYAYSQFNLGDDLFIKILCERYPETQFVLYAPKQYKRCFQGMRNIRFFPSDAFSSGASIIFSSIYIYASCSPKAVMRPFTLAVPCLFKEKTGERCSKIRKQCGSAVNLFFCWARTSVHFMTSSFIKNISKFSALIRILVSEKSIPMTFSRIYQT